MINPIESVSSVTKLNKRLVVLVPRGLSEASRFTQQIRWIALQQHRDVIFLALSDQGLDDLPIARELATLEALTCDPLFEVTSRQLDAANWVKAIQAVYRPGDMVLCHAGQLAPIGFGKGIPLEDYISEQMHLPVQLLSGFYQQGTVYTRGWWLSLLFWIGSLVILIGFSLIEFRVDHAITGMLRLFILGFLLVLEAGLIYELNKYTG